jgi:signal transduction histidine kinase/CheY-like chemotaxis protein
LALSTEQPTEVELNGNGGKSYTAEMRTSQMDWDGERAHLVWLRDVSDRKRMQSALIRSEKLQALGTLAGGIAHDFNNLLLAVSGNAKLALAQLPEEHPAYSNVVEIAKAASRAVALTKKIQSFSRQEEVKLQPIEIQPAVEETLSLLRATLPTRIELRARFTGKLPPVLADSSQVHQIMVNLATNAADAIGDRPGWLEFSGCPVQVDANDSTLSSKLPPGPYVKLAIQDNGPGMDRATLGRAFEPFFTTKPQGRGTGMGLAVVHGIMKSHSGEITAYSEIGKGTVFNLYFPAAQAVKPETLAKPAASPAQGEGRRILYVDDEEPLVLLITRTLKRLGYDVMGFVDPLKALHAFRADPNGFDALVTDLSMPAMSGTDLAREVLEIRTDLPIVLTSGYVRPQDHEIAKQIGIREVILKPDTVEDLGDTLHRLLEKRSGPPLAAAAGA